MSQESPHALPAIRINEERWNQSCSLAESWVENDEVPAIAFVVGRAVGRTDVMRFGRQTLADGGQPLADDSIFLIASITKPIVGMGVLRLVEQGEITLDERVVAFIPEFQSHGKRGVTIRNLLTHTSGLPDMLDNNIELRQAGASLEEFVTATCQVELDFKPGFGVQYQSMGFCILGEIIQRVSGMTCAEFLDREFFQPLGMSDTALGVPESWYGGEAPKVDRIAHIRLPKEQQSTDSWNWNGRYWRGLGAPWGGLLTTPEDMSRFAAMMVNDGQHDSQQILAPATVRAAIHNQLETMPTVPEAERRCRPWGLAWRLNWPSHSANFGDFLPPHAYGHWGATGSLLWIDPDSQSYVVLFTTQSQEPHGTYLARLSNSLISTFQF